MLRPLCTLLVLFIATAAFAGKHNEKLNIGDAAPAWKNLPGSVEKPHSLADLKEMPIVVVVFTCNSCPVAVEYEDRIKAFVERHKADVAVVAICVSRAEADNLEKVRARAKDEELSYPYLFDETQQIGRDYGATGTPEFFVLNKDRKIVYMGSLDDSEDAAKAKTDYLESAVVATKAGKSPEVQETYAHGCRIRYARQRKPAK